MSDDDAHASRIAEQLAMYDDGEDADIDDRDDDPDAGGDSSE